MLMAAMSASDTTMPLGYWPVSSSPARVHDRADRGARRFRPDGRGRDRAPFRKRPVKLLLDTILLHPLRHKMVGAPGLRRRRPGAKASWPKTRRICAAPPASRGQALDEAMNHRGPALVNVVISQGSARKPQQLRWHS